MIDRIQSKDEVQDFKKLMRQTYKINQMLFMFEAILWTDGVCRRGTAANHRHAGGSAGKETKQPTVAK